MNTADIAVPFGRESLPDADGTVQRGAVRRGGAPVYACSYNATKKAPK